MNVSHYEVDIIIGVCGSPWEELKTKPCTPKYNPGNRQQPEKHSIWNKALPDAAGVQPARNVHEPSARGTPIVAVDVRR